MKKKHFLVILLLLSLLVQCLIIPAWADNDTQPSNPTAATSSVMTQPPEIPPVDIPYNEGDDASVSYGCHSMNAQVPLGGRSRMLKTARAAILYETNSGTMLYSYNPDDKVYPASLVKVMTALLVIENLPMDQIVTVSSSMLSSIPMDAIKAGIKAGEVLTVRDLLYFMMLRSANDAAAILADVVAGSQEKFVKMMNQRSIQIGCTGTNFVDALGLHAEMQYTTARDVAKIVTEALKYEEFRSAFGAERYTVPANSISEERVLITTNYFLSKMDSLKYFDTRVTGGKSGAISTKDRSLVCTVKGEDLSLLCVVMGAEGIEGEEGYGLEWLGNFEEAAELFEYGLNNYTVAQILYDQKAVAQFPVTDGENHVVGRPIQTVFSAVPYGTTAEQLSWTYHQKSAGLKAPIKIGDSVGNVQVFYRNVCLAQSDMVSMNSSRVAARKIDSHENHSDGIGESMVDVLMVMGIIFGVLLGLTAVWFIIKLIRRAAYRSRKRKIRKNRQRSR